MNIPEPASLKVIHYPDPRLRSIAKPVTEFTPALRALAERMIELMGTEKGVGLAAPQVGVGLRVFVANATGEPQDTRVYINPELTDAQGSEQDEEGCLSLPGIRGQIWREKKARIRAADLDGKVFEEEASGFLARIWQHEIDHLNGMMIIDRMGPASKLAVRRKLRELEAKVAK